MKSAGGGSGGGSINIFYKGSIQKGSLSVYGGSGGSCYRGRHGGSGGAGSITIGNISTGTFVKDE